MDKRFCIFDMDGTLVDSMSYWKGLGRDYLEAQGLSPREEKLAQVQTMTMLEGAAYLMETFGISGPPRRIVDEMETIMAKHYRQDVPLKPGVKEYLERSWAQGCRLCVATATAEPLSHACLSRLGVDSLFEFILSCETLGVSKGRPDVYLESARRLGAAPGRSPSLRTPSTPLAPPRPQDSIRWPSMSLPTPETGLSCPLWRMSASWIGGMLYDCD